MKDLIRQKIAISDEIAASLKKQLQLESHSSNAYLAAAAWCDAKGYNHSADFFYRQSNEEREHMLRIFKYLVKMGAQPQVPASKESSQEFSTLRAAFEEALNMEITVTESIHRIYNQCRKANDFATEEFMRWFVNEQVEEETTAREALGLFDNFGSDPTSIMLVDERIKGLSAE
ncbi:MAG: ferritin [Cyclobacteriaceae bacterium]